MSQTIVTSVELGDKREERSLYSNRQVDEQRATQFKSIDHIVIKIITPTHVELERDAIMVTLPGEDGMFGVLPRHALLMKALKPGLVQISLDHHKHNNLVYFVYGGMTEITGTNINVVTEFALECTHLTKNEVLEQISSLQSKVSQETDAAQVDIINTDLIRYKALLELL